MTELENATTLVKLCKKLAKADLRHPQREPDFERGIELLATVIEQQQNTIDHLKARVEKLEGKLPVAD
jgi:hypothetical protein